MFKENIDSYVLRLNYFSIISIVSVGQFKTFIVNVHKNVLKSTYLLHSFYIFSISNLYNLRITKNN